MKTEKDIVETIKAEGKRELFLVVTTAWFIVLIMAIQAVCKLIGLFPFSWLAVFWPVFVIGVIVSLQFFGFLLFVKSCSRNNEDIHEKIF